MEYGTHDLCTDSGTSREQCHLSGYTEREAVLGISRQHHQGEYGVRLFKINGLVYGLQHVSLGRGMGFTQDFPLGERWVGGYRPQYGSP